MNSSKALLPKTTEHTSRPTSCQNAGSAWVWAGAAALVTSSQGMGECGRSIGVRGQTGAASDPDYATQQLCDVGQVA